MSYYNCNESIVQRSKGKSFAGALSYISGNYIKDIRSGKNHCYDRNDVWNCKIYCSENTPERMRTLQGLSDAVELAENRKNSQIARSIICALPKELTFDELERIVDNFAIKNFANSRFIAVAAIHMGKNKKDPSRNNPHAHILVTMRKVDDNGFCKAKDREHNRKDSLNKWRESLEREINRAYERNNMPERVSSKSYKVQGRTDVKPRKRLTRDEWERLNRNGERIDVYREHLERRKLEKEKEQERMRNFERMF